jgi:NAD(P)H-hydrate epimerase
LKSTTAAVQRDRFTAARRIRDRYGGICVLKGSGSLIVGPQQSPVSVCTGGNPGMASGGVGDVLTGLIAGLIAQGLSLNDAAQAGVTLHAEAADRAARADGERGLLASDLLPWIRTLANPSAP